MTVLNGFGAGPKDGYPGTGGIEPMGIEAPTK